MNKMGTVVKFTFLNKVKTKSFAITTLVLALLLSIALNIPYIIDVFTGDDQGTTKIGVVTANEPEVAASFIAFTGKQEKSVYELVEYSADQEQQLSQDLKEGKIKGYLQFEESEGGLFPGVSYTSKTANMDLGLQTALQAALQSVKAEYITKGSLNEEQIAALTMPVQIESLQAAEDGTADTTNGKKEPEGVNYFVVFASIILFFMTNMMTGNMIAAEVTSEKSSRIMEILITSVSPLAQMFGKIIGMFLVGLLQIFIFIAAIVANIMLPHNRPVLADMDLDFSVMNIDVIVFGLLLYILGYFLYATLFAAVGSIVSRTEELGQAAMPITMFSMAAFYITMFSMSTPDSTLLKVSSYIPFFSPVTLILRIGLGDTPAWEIAISLIVLVASIFLFGWLAAKIYRTGVLLYGKRPTIKELRKAMRAYKI